VGFVLCLFSCAKEEERSSEVPASRVEIDINTIIDHQFSNAYHHKEYYPNKDAMYAGYVGIIAISNENASWIYAYDLCCPYEAPMKNELKMDGSTIIKCPKCGSRYNLMDKGRVLSGPATEKLREYMVLKDGSFYRIRN